MSHLIASTATRAPAVRDANDDIDHADRNGKPARPWIWTLIEALAYAGAYVDPSGLLAVERLRQAKEEERNAR
jgi:hypothetical protein